MVAMPSREELHEYAAENGLRGAPLTQVAKRMIADDRKRKVPPLFLDPDIFCGGLLALQEAADAAGIRRDVFAAAVPAAARTIVQHSLYDLDKDI